MTARRFEFSDSEPMNGDGRHGPPGGGEAEAGAYVRDLWNFLRRNRLLIGIAPLLVLAAALLATRYIRPVYEADTTIRIDEDRSSVPILDVLKTLSAGGSGIGTEMQVLRSRTLAEAVVDSLRLQVQLRAPRGDRDVLVHVRRVDRLAPRARYEIRNDGSGRFEVRQRGGGQVLARAGIGDEVRVPGVVFELQPGAARASRIELGVERYDDILRSVRRRLVVGRPNRDADIVEVRFQDTDRQLTAAVPNVLADRFMAFRNRDRTRESESTVLFLGDQLGDISGQLRTAESELQRFREGSGVVSLEAEASASIAGLGELKAQRDGMAAEAAALRQVVAQLGSGGGRGTDRRIFAFPTLLRIPAASQLLSSLAELEDERARRLQIRRPEDPEIVALDARIREVEANIVELAGTYAQGLNAQVASLDATLGQHRAELQRVPAQEIAFARLLREVKVLEEIYTVLQTTLKEQEVLAAVEDVSVRVVDPAVLPLRPVRPNVPLTAGLALLVGAVLGLGGAFVREQVDTAVHTREDLQRAAHGVPLLGTVPRIRPAGVRSNGRLRFGRAPVELGAERLMAAHEPQSPVSESYRSLRTSIAFSRAGAAPKTLVFTSPLPGDGKSTTAANLAVTLARQGARCVLVDADMRRGGLHGLFGAAREPGLSNVLLGRVTAVDAIRTVQAGDVSLDLLAAGVAPPNPAELVGSQAMAELVAGLAADYDAVIVDAPPLNLVTDAALIGVHADGVVLVARAGVTDRAAVAYALEQLRGVRARVLGTVLNDSGDGRDRYYGSYVPDAAELAPR